MLICECSPFLHLWAPAADTLNTAGYLETERSIFTNHNTFRRSYCAVFRFDFHLEEEGIRVVSEFAQDLLLYFGVNAAFLVLQRRIDLSSGQKDIPAKRYAHHVHIIPTVPERRGQHDVD